MGPARKTARHASVSVRPGPPSFPSILTVLSLSSAGSPRLLLVVQLSADSWLFRCGASLINRERFSSLLVLAPCAGLSLTSKVSGGGEEQCSQSFRRRSCQDVVSCKGEGGCRRQCKEQAGEEGKQHRKIAVTVSS